MTEVEIRQMIRAEVRTLIEPLRDAVAELTAERRPGKVLTAETDDLSLEELRERDWSQAGLSRHTIEQIEQEQAPNVLTVDDDPDETALAAEEYEGVPLAAGYVSGHHVVSEPMASGFDTFAPPGSAPTGALDRSDAARRLGQLIAESQQRQQQVDVDGEPYDPRFLVRGF